jgi:hypothetical protein
LALDVGEDLPVAIPLQALLDEGAENDLHAHRELECGRRYPRQNPSLVEDVLGKNEKDLGPVLERHVTLRFLPTGLSPSGTPARI